MKCEHELVQMKDGTRDMFCVKCSNKFKQAAMSLPEISIDVKIKPPDISGVLRELSKQIHNSQRTRTYL